MLCPLSEPGYLYPAIAVGLELSRRRHQCSVLAAPRTASVLREAGLAMIAADEYGSPAAFSATQWAVRTSDQYRTIWKAAVDTHADVLVTSILCVGALLAAESLDIPVVVLGFAAHLWNYRSGGAREPERPARRAWRTRELMRIYAEHRAMAGLRPQAARPDPLVGDALLLRGDRALEYPWSVLPDRVHHVGPCLWEPAADAAELDEITAQLSLSGKPVTYVHLARIFRGTSPWPVLNAAFTDGPFQAVVEQGRSEDPRPDPAADILLVRKPWMGPLVAMAGLVLTSATSAPVLGALVRGRPLVVFPEGSEQALLAGACVRAGVAAHLPGETSDPVAVLRAAWTSAAMRRAAARLGRRLAVADGPARAANVVESAVTGTLVPSQSG